MEMNLTKFRELMFSSELRRVCLQAGQAGQAAEVTLRCGGALLLSQKYVASSGAARIELFALSGLIESYMQAQGLSAAPCELAVEGMETKFFMVVHLSHPLLIGTPEEFLAGHFLTLSPVRRLPEGVDVSLAAWLEAGEMRNRTVTVRARVAGSRETFLYSFNSGKAIMQQEAGIFTFTLSAVELYAGMPAEYEAAEPLEVTVRLGSRSATFFLDRALSADRAFRFRNCFGCEEEIYLPGSEVRKQQSSAELAMIGGEAAQYDRVTEVSYELEAGPLAAGEAVAVGELLASHEVLRTLPADCGGGWASALITDSTCETGGDSEPDSVKIIWRYTGEGAPLMLPGAGKGIFTGEYNDTFE